MVRLFAAFVFFLVSTLALAQAWPAKPITVVVGYPPGGSTDLAGRAVAELLAKRLNVAVTVENLGGAGGTIGAQKVASAAPDGYTLLLASNNEIAIAKSINSAIRYESMRDFSPVGYVGSQPMVLVAHPGVAAKTTDELVAYARANPGKLSFASSGVDTALHFAGELINLQAGIQMVHVPDKGAAPMVTDVIGGQIPLAVLVLSSALQHVKSGKMKAFGITENKRSEVAPEIPTLNESKALEGLDISSWFGLYAPAKTPREVIERLNAALNDGLRSPEVREKLAAAGMRLSPGTSQALSDFTQKEIERYRRIAREANIKAE